MADAVRFGVIQVAQIWCVMTRDRAEMAFATRDGAVAAARAMASRYLERGDACDVLVQDEIGRLVPLAGDLA